MGRKHGFARTQKGSSCMTVGMNQLAPGMALNINGNIFIVTEHQHVKPGKGSAFVRIKIKNVRTDAVLDRTLRTSDKFEDILLDEEELEYLYNTGDVYHFMNHVTYEQVEVPLDDLSGTEKFLLENLTVTGLINEGCVIKVVLPIFIEAEIIESAPGVRGDSSKSGTKPAKIATGTSIQVPLFVNQGDWIKIDTRSGQYVERIQK